MNKMETPRKEDWNQFWDRDESKKFMNASWSKRRIITVMEPFTGKGLKALDAGCGTGFFSKYFCDRGMDTVSFDYSQSALDLAKKLTEGRSRIVKGDLITVDGSDIVNEKFDLIFSDGLFEHFSTGDQDTMMTNLKNVLSDRGVIVTFVPNRWSPWELIRPFFMPGIEETPFVIRELIDLNERNGLHVVQSGGVNTLPFSVSPEGGIARIFGMLLYTISRKG